MLRFLVTLAFVIALAWAAATVKIGDKTLVQHVRAIWHTPAAQDLKRGVEDTARPAVNRIEHGAQVGYKALTEDAGSAAGSGSAGSGMGMGIRGSGAP